MATLSSSNPLLPAALSASGYPRINLKVKRHTIWPFAIALAIFMASGSKDLAAPSIGFSYDKLAHLLVFGLLATAALRIPRISNLGWRGVFITILLISTFGALDEYWQSFTADRAVELNDWIADSLGAIIASILYYRWHSYRRFLEWPTSAQSRRDD